MAIRAVLTSSLLGLSQALVVDTRDAKDSKSGSDGVCDCMSWADVYFSGKASCGRGNELYFLSKYGFSAAYAATEPITGLPHKVCYDFFKNFLTPSCVNIDLYPFPANNQTGKQWCYVSNDCSELNGGEFATNQMGFAQGAWHNLESTGTLAWKVCEQGVDPIMKHWDIQDVLDTALYSDVSLSRILRLAYPAVQIDWSEAVSFMEELNDAYAPGLTLSQMVGAVPAIDAKWGTRAVEVHSALGDLVLSEQPTILDSPGHGDDYWLLQGRSVHEVRRIPSGNMAYLGGHFYDEFTVTCIMGCASGSERKGAVDLDTL